MTFRSFRSERFVCALRGSTRGTILSALWTWWLCRRQLTSMQAALVFGVVLSTGAPSLAQSSRPVPHEFSITVLSGRADMVSAGDALIRIDVPRVVPLANVTVALNGADITAKFRRDDISRTMTGLVDGLKHGENRLFVDSNGEGSGRPTAELTLVNYPKEGPIFSGPHQAPFACEAHKFIMLVIGGPLPATASPPECSLDFGSGKSTLVYYFYRTTAPLQGGPPGTTPWKALSAAAIASGIYPTDLAETTNSLGVTVKYIVRTEIGSANRGIYTIQVLHDPIAQPDEPNFHTRPDGWNQRLFYVFGTGCAGGLYRQGTIVGFRAETATRDSPSLLPAIDFPLSNGYIVASSTLNDNGTNCNDVVAAETMMMVKERVIEAFGVPKHTIGFGLSGGSIQQYMIADNYPGLLDGIVPGGSFPDSVFAGSKMTTDAWLLHHYFTTPGLAQVPWNRDANGRDPRTAVTGFADYSTVTASNVIPNARAITPRAFCPPAELFPPNVRWYDPISDPTGARCDLFSAYRNVFGVDPDNGFVPRPMDNVGVQYGLGALNSRAISVEQFLDLNEKIGGFDADGNFVAARTEADLDVVRIAYQTGRVTNGGGGLASIPIIDYRSYSDDQANAAGVRIGDVHLRYFSFAMRERLIKANGHADNQVMLVENLRNATGAVQLYTPVRSQLLPWAFKQMDIWLEKLTNDTSSDPPVVKVLRAKPGPLDNLGILADGCSRRSRTAPSLPVTPAPPDLFQTQMIGPSTDPNVTPENDCAVLYPVNSYPRGVAGESIASDVVKCQLKPITWAEYAIAFTAEQQARLQQIFPAGVCDYSKPGVEQQPPLGTWLDYSTD